MSSGMVPFIGVVYDGRWFLKGLGGHRQILSEFYIPEADTWYPVQNGMVSGWRNPSASLHGKLYALDCRDGCRLRIYDETTDTWSKRVDSRLHLGDSRALEAVALVALNGKLCIVRNNMSISLVDVSGKSDGLGVDHHHLWENIAGKGQFKSFSLAGGNRLKSHIVYCQKLEFVDCMELKSLPDGLSLLQSLEHLRIRYCQELDSLPEKLGQLKKLKSLKLESANTLTCLPNSLAQLESLECLALRCCPKLESLPLAFQEPPLRRKELQKAIQKEINAQAEKIRDCLRVLHEDSKASILAVNARFYEAFKNGDLAAMHTIWSRGDHVFCVHPGAGGSPGYDLVMGSWELVCGAAYEFPLHIDLKNVEVHVIGDMGYITCMELIKTRGSSWGIQVATNVFERIDRQWFICIHHASHAMEVVRPLVEIFKSPWVPLKKHIGFLKHFLENVEDLSERAEDLKTRRMYLERMWSTTSLRKSE
ncbi:hypothetical protein ACLOJK_021900 [Asimina triloba]